VPPFELLPALTRFVGAPWTAEPQNNLKRPPERLFDRAPPALASPPAARSGKRETPNAQCWNPEDPKIPATAPLGK